MKVGIGFNNEQDSVASGKKIAKQAVSEAGIENPKYALSFYNNNVDAEGLLKGIQEVLGTEVPVVGGSGIGIITNEVVSYEGSPAGIVVIEDDIDLMCVYADGLDRGEEALGEKIASRLEFNDNDIMLLFFDTVRKEPTENSPPVMNSSTPLLKGIRKHLDNNIQIIGGGTLGDHGFSFSSQFTGYDVKSQSATALLLHTDEQADVAIMHGCSPKDGIYHTITRIEGPVLYEIDHKPVVDVINEMYGNDDWQNQLPVKRLTVGKNIGDKYSLDFNEKEYINRLILGVLPDKSGIILFESDFEVGTEIQFMLRDSAAMIESAINNTDDLIKKVLQSGRKPDWGFYIDCAGRSALFSETMNEEAEEVQKIMNSYNIPLFGFYSGVELAPLAEKTCGLDWTGVLILFSR